MWHRHRGGRAVRGHALPPLPHLPPPTHPTSTDCRLASLALSLPTSCRRTFATDTTVLFPAVWLPPIPPSPHPSFPSLLPPFTFLTAILFESPSGLLFTPPSSRFPIHPILPSLSFPLAVCLSGILVTSTDVFHFHLSRDPRQ